MVTNENGDCGVQLSEPVSALGSLVRTRVLLAWVRPESHVTEDPLCHLQAATPPQQLFPAPVPAGQTLVSLVNFLSFRLPSSLRKESLKPAVQHNCHLAPDEGTLWFTGTELPELLLRAARST